MKHLTDEQIDALPAFRHEDTPERLRYRRDWGVRAGRRARRRGVPMSDNPFTPSPVLPMRGGWIEGWKKMEEELRVTTIPG